MSSRHIRVGLVLAALVALLDQTSKWWIVDVIMRPPKTIPITDYFNLVLVYNRGVSFGMLNMQSPHGALILSVVALAITSGLLVWLWRVEKRLIASALGLIIGGAAGNVVDRLTIGAVADFLDFHFAGYHWPAFNVADMAITCGAIVIIGESFFSGRRKM